MSLRDDCIEAAAKADWMAYADLPWDLAGYLQIGLRETVAPAVDAVLAVVEKHCAAERDRLMRFSDDALDLSGGIHAAGGANTLDHLAAELREGRP